MRYLILALLVLVLVADLGWKAWSERPYVVTGYAVDAGSAERPPILIVQYRVPGGRTGEWRSFTSTQSRRCFNYARIGRQIPKCMWSFSDIDR